MQASVAPLSLPYRDQLPGAKLNLASVEDQLEWFKAGGYVDSGVTIEDLVDTSYVEMMS